MANPLSKRYPRELKNNLGKYLGMFFMMAFAVAFTSGFLLAASSIEKIGLEIPEKYNVEDGRFACDFEPEEEAIDAVEDLGVTVYPDFYKNVPLVLDGNPNESRDITARLFANREHVNLAAYAEGRAPEAANEVAFDRVFMSNNDVNVGDSVTLEGKPFTVVGVCTLADNQALFEDNTSFMFDALTFTVGQVTKDALENFSQTPVYNYSFKFNDQSLDVVQRNNIEEDMIDALGDNDAVLSNFVDAEDNQGIGYAMEDVEGDQVMWTVLLVTLVVIMAFVFVVLTGATIEAESSVIGTMLASGWRKGEIVRHYLFLPAIIGLIAVIVGLVLGMTFMSEPMKNLYYNSYSLPPYEFSFNPRVIFITAVVPYALLIGITLIGLLRKMKFTPLQFLRHEVSSRKRNASLPLPARLSYPTRFRMRVLLRNASHFITLFFGITFASLLLLFGTCMMPVVRNYALELQKTVKAPHQYVLKVPLELDGTNDERDMYAAALRLVEDHARIEANQDAIDAAKRLEDNDELLDALERLQDNKALMDAFDRLEDNDELMDALDRLQDNDELMDALDHLQDNEELMDALDRLQDNEPLMDALERLQDNEELMNALDRLQDNEELMDALDRLQDNKPLMNALERLQDNEPLMDALERLQNNQPLMDALDRLQSNQEVMDAASRLQNNQDLVDAASRLQSKTELVYWAQWAQANPDYVAAATRVAAGSNDPADLAYVSQLNDTQRAGLQMLATIDEQTQADMQLVQAADAQTQADMELMQNLDAQTQADLELLQNVDDATQADIDLLQNVDDATQADIDLLQNVDDATQADIDLLQNVDDATQADIDLLQNVDDATQADIDLLQNLDDATQADVDILRDVDDQTQADIDLLQDLDDATQADVDILRDVDDQTQADIDLLQDLDDATQADIDLIRNLDEATRADLELLRDMDEDLLDDVRLAADIDEDANMVNTKINPDDVIAQAEKYAIGTVEIERAFGGKSEEVSVYGIQPNSRYWTDLPVEDGKVYAGAGLIEKTKVALNKTVPAYNRRTGDVYHVTVVDENTNKADTNLYMTLADFNRLFDNDADYFNAYASEDELELDNRYVARDIVPDDMMKMANQMEDSMGNIVGMMLLMAIPIYLVLVYLLTKTVIDRSARSISYMKVFGYRNKEVDGLYVRPITFWVLFSLIASLPIIVVLIKALLRTVFMSYAGNFPLIIPPSRYALLVVIGMATYVLVAILHIRRIKKVPLELAMKVQE